MEIFERIKDFRRNTLCITQDEFAQKIHISRSNLASIEIGRISVTPRVIIDICNVFKIREEWLRTGQGSMRENNNVTKNEKLMNYTASILKSNDSIIAELIKSFIITYEELDDNSKAVLEDIGKKYLDNMKKSE